MKPCCTYILYSEKLDRFYVGYTCDSLQNRLQKHLLSKSGFTAKAKDWKIVFLKFAKEKADAMSFEKQIKKAKSRKYILELLHSDENQADTNQQSN